jgi:dihydrofolate reductase
VPPHGTGARLARKGRVVTEVVLIAAVADNGVIGDDNAIPWRLKSDMRRLRAITMNKPVVMGRKTFASIKRPLPGRTNIVITRDPGFSHPGVVAAPSFETALALAQADALQRGASEIAVLGGAEIYALFLDVADRLEITEVHATPKGDTRFPAIDRNAWEEVARVRHDAGPEDNTAFSYVTYRRRKRTD